MNERMTKIYDELVLPFMAEHQIEDTTENRLMVLEGVYKGIRRTKVGREDAWEKFMNQLAVSSEINVLNLRISLRQIKIR